ncbi:MAG TPA: Bax inhibitor-1/YccA family protein [Gemmatimonadaceae bacterium]|jgi:FtsH-binding integral membrane protein|nr:Bax inhibitor-1/YccA family protein [Gemmatimonadaceae bacterium]
MGFSYAPSITQVRTGAERAALVRRTYGLVFLSIIVTILGAAFAFTQQPVMAGVIQHPIITGLCVFIPLIMAQRAAREFPKNLILTFLFTFVEGIYIAPFMMVAERSAPGVVSEAAILTFAAFGVLSLYALVSRRDFSAWGSFFMVGLIVLFVAMILNAFIGSAAGGLWIASIGVLIFSGLLVFDTWRLLRSGAYGQDDYVLAAVSIYLDLLNMFLFILSLLGGGRRR